MREETKIKIMFRLVLIFSITSLSVHAQQKNDFEQLAFNYFATEIVTHNYPNAKEIYYTGQTENERSIAGPFAKCFHLDSNFSQFYHRQKKSEADRKTIESGTFHQFKKSAKAKSNRLNLRIYRAVTNDEVVYIYIKVFKENYFVDHYLIKVFADKIVDACHMNEII
jgi:hypothetical protein